MGANKMIDSVKTNPLNWFKQKSTSLHRLAQNIMTNKPLRHALIEILQFVSLVGSLLIGVISLLTIDGLLTTWQIIIPLIVLCVTIFCDYKIISVLSKGIMLNTLVAKLPKRTDQR